MTQHAVGRLLALAANFSASCSDLAAAIKAFHSALPMHLKRPSLKLAALRPSTICFFSRMSAISAFASVIFWGVKRVVTFSSDALSARGSGNPWKAAIASSGCRASSSLRFEIPILYCRAVCLCIEVACLRKSVSFVAASIFCRKLRYRSSHCQETSTETDYLFSWRFFRSSVFSSSMEMVSATLSKILTWAGVKLMLFEWSRCIKMLFESKTEKPLQISRRFAESVVDFG